MEELSNDSCYLELNSNPVRFESVSQVTNVFFDDCNRQVSYNLYKHFIT